MYCLVATINK